MLDDVIIATKNQGKLEEFARMLSKLGIKARSLAAFDPVPEVEEDGDTFEENAKKKAVFYRNLLNLPVIADDSGLMVDVLNGKPGIYSARFAGEEKNDQKNNEKLLHLLEGIEEEKRTAKFVSVIAFALPGESTITVRGECEGNIGFTPEGNNGFGYDPLFYLPDYKKNMAEISPELKNQISHRAKALQKLMEELNYRFL